MAKTAKKTETTDAPTNGGLVFERLGKDFEIPRITKGSMWEGPLRRLADEAPGEVVALYKTPYENARKVYNRAKALSKLGNALGIKVNVAVRKQGGDAVLFAQVEA